MAITKMKAVTLSCEHEGLDRMLSELSSCNIFHAEEASHVLDGSRGGKVYEESTRYMEDLARMESIMRSLQIEMPQSQGYAEEISLDEIEAKLNQVEGYFGKVNDQLMSMSHLKKEDMIAIDALREYNFDEINHSEFVSVMFGRMPVQSFEKWESMGNDSVVMTVLHSNKQYHWVLCICLWEDQMKIDELFETLFFEPIAIPSVDDQKLIASCREIISTIYGYLKFRGDIQRMNKYVAVYGSRYEVKGFVPADRMDALHQTFDGIPTLTMESADPKQGDAIQPPVELKNNIISKPFDMFIEMYGLPGYFDFDPTSFLSITYGLLFGIMFGDLGQGFVLVVACLILNHFKPMKLAQIGARIGVFSMIFGIFFGSFFGDEEIIGEVLHGMGITFLPFHAMSAANTMPLLIGAVALGAVLILISITANIINCVKKKDWQEGLFSQNGLAGFIFYGSIGAGVVLQMGFGIAVVNPVTIGLCLILPLILILFKEPLGSLANGHGFHAEESWGSYVMTGVFELLEVLLSFVSNTMSFMRVGGFVLSHAGMMMVVMTLRDMVGSASVGGIAVLVFGNLFVMALEGLIVGIQSLRLEYYEMFSRYFNATGRKFEPVAEKN